MIQDIDSKLKSALISLDHYDSELLINNASERSIAHKFAIYLMNEFGTYDVDNEYNLNIENDRDRKELWEIRAKLEDLNKTENRRHKREIDGTKYYHLSVYPDIIVHERRTNERNLLIIEIKKSSNDNSEAVEFDKFKIRKYTRSESCNEFKYKYGALITVQTGDQRIGNHSIKYFLDGNEITI